MLLVKIIGVVTEGITTGAGTPILDVISREMDLQKPVENFCGCTVGSMIITESM